MTTTPAVSATLAEFVARADFGKAQAQARRATRRTLLNVIALATAAAHRPSVQLVFGLHERLGSPPALSLVGRSERLGLFAAPLVNGMAMHVDDYDDTHLPTIVHPGAPVVPAALAAAECVGASGADTMAGVLAGVEAALRVADGVCPAHLERGWHPTATCGRLGAAMAASRILGLDADRTLHALGLAATQTGGVLTVNGTMTKAFHPGKAAADGIEAALLAQRGWTGPAAPIEGRHGFAAATSPKVDLARMIDDLDDRWEIEQNAFKPYACGIVSHAAIDAAISLRGRVAADDIEEVEVRVPAIVLHAMGIEDPSDALQTKFSVYHCVTVGLLDGAGGPPQFSDERAVAPEVVALRRRVRTVVDPSVPVGAARLRVRTRDGRELEEEVIHATASAERPMTDEQLEAKARGLMEPVIGAAGAGNVLRRCGELPTASDVSGLLAATRP